MSNKTWPKVMRNFHSKKWLCWISNKNKNLTIQQQQQQQQPKKKKKTLLRVRDKSIYTIAKKNGVERSKDSTSQNIFPGTISPVLLMLLVWSIIVILAKLRVHPPILILTPQWKTRQPHFYIPIFLNTHQPHLTFLCFSACFSTRKQKNKTDPEVVFGGGFWLLKLCKVKPWIGF